MTDLGRDDHRRPECRAGGVRVVATAVVTVVAVYGFVDVVGAGPAVAVETCPDIYLAPASVPAELRDLSIAPGVARADIEDALGRLQDADADVHVVPEPPAGVDAWVERFFFAVDPERPGDPATSIDPGLEVWVCLGGKVPEVHGKTVGAAAESTRAAGLELGTTAVAAWRVAELDQAEGAVLPFGTVVNVTAVWPVVPPAPSAGAGVAPGAIGQPDQATTPGTGGVSDDAGTTDVLARSGDGVTVPRWQPAALLLLVGLVGVSVLRRRRLAPGPQVDVRRHDDVPSPGNHRGAP